MGTWMMDIGTLFFGTVHDFSVYDPYDRHSHLVFGFI